MKTAMKQNNIRTMMSKPASFTMPLPVFMKYSSPGGFLKRCRAIQLSWAAMSVATTSSTWTRIITGTGTRSASRCGKSRACSRNVTTIFKISCPSSLMGCNGLGTHRFSVSYGNDRFHLVYKDCHNNRTGYYNLPVGDILTTVSCLAEASNAGETLEMGFTGRARRKLGSCADAIEAELKAVETRGWR